MYRPASLWARRWSWRLSALFFVGASIPPDVVTGGILGVAFAITSGAGTETALLLGLPIATLTLILKNIYLGMFIPMLSQKADGYAERADLRGIERMHLIAGFGLSLMLAAVVTVSFWWAATR